MKNLLGIWNSPGLGPGYLGYSFSVFASNISSIRYTIATAPEKKFLINSKTINVRYAHHDYNVLIIMWNHNGFLSRVRNKG